MTKQSLIRSIRMVELLIVGYSLLMMILVAIFGGHLGDRQTIYLAYAICIISAIIFVILRSLFPSKITEYLSLIYPLALLIIYYEISGYHIHLFFRGFYDSILVNIENLIFPVHPTIWFQKLNHPLFTEWMMFGYSTYLLLLPITVSWLFFRKKFWQSQHLLLSLIIAFFFCYIGFFLFPIEGPRFYLRDFYTVKFSGYFFKSITDLIEGNAMLHGGCFPSAHCAAATVMLLLAYRYDRLLFAWTTPIIITLYISTIYGRYHYPSDFVSGFIVGVIAIRLATVFDDFWKKKSAKISTSDILEKRPEPITEAPEIPAIKKP